jgi:hypothetical protein
LSYRPARLHRLAKSIPRNRFLGSINVYKYGLWRAPLRVPTTTDFFQIFVIDTRKILNSAVLLFSMMFVLRLVMIWFRHWLRHGLRLLVRHWLRVMVRKRFSLDRVRVCRCCPPLLQLLLHIYQL